MTPPDRRGIPPRSGLTLLELLTSVSIGLMLAVLATVSFLQVRGMLERIRIRLDMHSSARFLYQNIAEQFSSLQQDGAYWIETRKNDGSGDGQISITFLKGKIDEKGFMTRNGSMTTPGEAYGYYMNRCCDLNWSSIRWDQARSALYMGCSSPPHQFRLNSTWVGPQGDYSYGGQTNQWGNGCDAYFINMPQPLQQAVPYPAATPTGSSQAALSGNRYGSPDLINDLSDYQDLQNQMGPVVRNVTSCVIETIMSDGSVVDADIAQDRTLPYDGSFVDGHVSAAADGTYPYKKRPRLIRLLVDMTDPVTHVSQSFSFSFQPPGLLPSTFPAGNPIP